MHLLFLAAHLPYPPRQGGALRTWGLISTLARRHAVSLLAFGDPAEAARSPVRDLFRAMEVVPEPAPRTLPRRLRDLLLTSRPDMALRLESPVYRQRLGDLLARDRFDVVLIEGIEMALFLETVERARPRPRVLFDDFNCEYLLQKRAFLTDVRYPWRWHGALYSLIQWRRLRRYEANICRRADFVVAVSTADADALQALVPDRSPLVVPNGVDVSAYDPRTPPAAGMGEHALVFTGKMDFRPNVDAALWFARAVLPLVRREVPDAHFWVVGQRPHPRLAPLRENPAVTLTGYVGDTRPYIAGASVYVAPLRIGGGTRLKLLEAMAMGRAVVATRLGAEGYEVRDGEELLLADDAASFACAVLSLLKDPARRAALGQAARRFVERRYDWSVLAPRIEALLEQHHPLSDEVR